MSTVQTPPQWNTKSAKPGTLVFSSHGILKPYLSSIDNLLVKRLVSETFYIPGLLDLIDEIPGVFDTLVGRYNQVMGETEEITPEVKAAQALAFDESFFAYDHDKDNYELYTCNPALLQQVEGGERFDPDRILVENKAGRVYSFRLDVKYAAPGLYFVRAVQPRSLVDRVSLETFTIFPYLILARLMKAIELKLSQGRVLSIVQDMGGPKKRYVTIDKSVLSEWSGVPEFSNGLNPVVFLPKGWIYLPTLGAPSTSLGLTRIELLRIDSIKVIHKNTLAGEISKQSGNPLTKTLQNEIISSFVMKRLNPEDENIQWKQWFSKALESFGQEIQEETFAVARQLTRLSDREQRVLWTALSQQAPQLREEFAKLTKVIRGYEEVPLPISEDEFYLAANRGVVKTVAISNNCKFYTSVGTLNEEILSIVYGEGYFREMESTGVRVNKYLRAVFNGMPENEAREFFNVSPEDEKESRERKPRFAPAGNIVSLRNLFATDGDRFYSQVNLDKLHSFAILTSRKQLDGRKLAS